MSDAVMPSGKPKKSRKTLWIIVSAVVLVLIVIGVISGGSKSSDSTATSPTTAAPLASVAASPVAEKIVSGSIGPVVVDDITNCGAAAEGKWGGKDSDTKNWYWGACFTAPGLQPMDKVSCEYVGYDVNGEEVDRVTVLGGVANTGAVIKQGDTGSMMPDSTKEIVQAIATVTVDCSQV